MSVEKTRTIGVSNLVNKDKEGLVQVELDGKPVCQLSISEARQFAQQVNELAAVAEVEAMLLAFLMDRVEISLEQAARVLADFRMRRGK